MLWLPVWWAHSETASRQGALHFVLFQSACPQESIGPFRNRRNCRRRCAKSSLVSTPMPAPRPVMTILWPPHQIEKHAPPHTSGKVEAFEKSLFDLQWV